LGAKLIIALNMTDVAASRNHRIDVEKLSQRLRVPVVRTVANRNDGTKELLDRIVNLGQGHPASNFRIDYGKEMEREIKKLEEIIQKSPLSLNYPPRWLAIKLLEEDEEATRMVQGKTP
jgi:ferrous iron transport protein B